MYDRNLIPNLKCGKFELHLGDVSEESSLPAASHTALLLATMDEYFPYVFMLSSYREPRQYGARIGLNLKCMPSWQHVIHSFGQWIERLLTGVVPILYS